MKRRKRRAPSAIQHVQFAIGLAQFAGEVEAEAFEHLDFYRGMGFAELLKILKREHVALDVRVGGDVGRARSAVEEGHLAEGHPRRKHREPVAAPRRADIR